MPASEPFKKIPMKQGLGDKLRQAVNELTADVWGIEANAIHGLSVFFNTLAQQQSRSPDQYTIRITNIECVRADLFYEDTLLYELRVNDLLPILGVPAFYRPDQEKTSGQVSRYLDSLATQFGVPTGDLVVCLSVQKKVYALLRPSGAERAITFSQLVRFFVD